MHHKQLEYFLALAETLHFGRASERCYISAPTLSRNIKQLEQLLGAKLFIRDNRQVALSDAGEHFITYAKNTLMQWQQLKASLHGAKELQGALSIYCSVSAAYSFLHPLLSAVRERYCGVEVKLHTGDPAYALERVLDHHEDVAIAAKPAKLPAQIAFRRLGWSQLVFIAPKTPCDISRQVANSPSIPWQQLPFIIPEQGENRTRLISWWRKRRIQPPIYAQVSGHEALVSMVSLGLGVALIPQVVLENSPFAQSVQILNVDDAPPPFEIGLVAQQRRLSESVLGACWQLAAQLK
ncbi:HTH-type transcriptional activator IlvY [Pseudoalteromonas sp. MM17-2]|uniref:HTH-type transcriptional activator IlvY n=1 Tax=unclassified Pseudoalteromonas TaxID=194690 RepID=UPI001EF5DF21|nr:MULTISPECIES: HTH-type transcriptional activator IlvY [unclassified Pseudoalteromonas]MCG7543013.1 HTH-type transcriptional activator IlvY [Pseudoalteromonas sp. MM17-2]MCG7571333.1 HTH-type transcriptional activator IlvY [Pseudoalteromonas sp. CNC9-20]